MPFTRVEVSNHIFNTLREQDYVDSVVDINSNMVLWYESRDCRTLKVKVKNCDARFMIKISGNRHDGHSVQCSMKSEFTNTCKLLDLNRVFFLKEIDQFVFGHSEDSYLELFPRLFMKAMNSASDILQDEISGLLQSYDSARLKVERAKDEFNKCKERLNKIQSQQDSIPKFKL